jgi:endophilin-A
MELVQVMHDFEAEDQGELSLTVGDYVVVRQVCHIIDWSEGECKGKAGWFPSLYVERRQRIPARKVADASPGV